MKKKKTFEEEESERINRNMERWRKPMTKEQLKQYNRDCSRIEIKQIPREGDLILVWNKQHNPKCKGRPYEEVPELGVVHTIEKYQYHKKKIIRFGYVRIDDWFLNEVECNVLERRYIEGYIKFKKLKLSEQDILGLVQRITNKKEKEENINRHFSLLESNAKHSTGSFVPLSFVAEIIERNYVKW